ncbi:SDR family oxidoreductase [Candidatus Babeliales bacterium]|nr:SDR family oxidoreductase [Candidatus Babeliales bacterium]
MVKTVLISGGAGFLGSHLCKRFCAEGFRVIALDDLSSGSIQNLTSLQNDPLFAFIESDITKPIDIPADIILNFACPASPPRYQSDPIKTFKTSIFGTYNLLELARNYNSLFLQASTSEIYGSPLQHPQTESYWGNVNPIGIRSCYDEGKRAAETLCHDYLWKKNVKTKIIRIFNTYGPYMDMYDGRVVSNFIVQALQQKPLHMYGDGKSTRSFCYVDDLIEGIFKFTVDPSSHSGPVNLGNPDEITLKKLAEEIIKLTETTSQIIHQDRPSDDPQRRCPDISLAKKLLNWYPGTSLQEGLLKTIQYFSSLLSNKNHDHGIQEQR